MIGNEHRKWLVELGTDTISSQEPLVTKNGELIAKPLFCFKRNGKLYDALGTKCQDNGYFNGYTA